MTASPLSKEPSGKNSWPIVPNVIFWGPLSSFLFGGIAATPLLGVGDFYSNSVLADSYPSLGKSPKVCWIAYGYTAKYMKYSQCI